ncbi:MAG: ABC transporter substrate-binding protein [Alphaproteobacteria bacterium]|nr:ABC transporter substrate-binding protein [Alphaproteobacteria bacterium]
MPRFVGTLLWVFCGLVLSLSTVANAQSSAPIGSLILGVGPDASAGSVLAGVRKGIFQKHGVTVQLKVFNSGQESLEAVLTGQADTTINGPFNIPPVAARGGKIKILAELERSDQQFGVAAKTGIKGPQDLIGKKVGTQFNTSPDYYYRLYTKKYGLDEGKITLQNIAFAQLVPALAKGDIDAFFAFEPHITRAVEAVPGATIIHRSGQEGVMPLLVYLGASEKLYSNKALAVAFMKGLVEAGDWVNSNRDEAAAMLVAEFSLKPEDAKRFNSYFDYSVRWNRKSMAELEAVNQFMSDRKLLPQTADLSKLVAVEFLKEAAPGRVE